MSKGNNIRAIVARKKNGTCSARQAATGAGEQPPAYK
jgi:hypothetical protein